MSQTAVARLLRAFSGVMAKLKMEWYVFGAQAVVVHGRPRMTADVDITIELGAHGIDALVGALTKAGFALRVSPTRAFLEQSRVIPLVHTRTEMPVDVVLAGPGLEQEFLDRAELLDLGGVLVPVISVEDLLVTKILAGRPKDLDDARGVVAEKGKRIDLQRVREVLRALESALGQSDLLPVLEGLLSGSNQRKPAPRSKRTRRATRR